MMNKSMQSSFVTAQIQYAKTGDEVTKEILVTALNERVNILWDREVKK